MFIPFLLPQKQDIIFFFMMSRPTKNDIIGFFNSVAIIVQFVMSHFKCSKIIKAVRDGFLKCAIRNKIIIALLQQRAFYCMTLT